MEHPIYKWMIWCVLKGSQGFHRFHRFRITSRGRQVVYPNCEPHISIGGIPKSFVLMETKMNHPASLGYPHDYT